MHKFPVKRSDFFVDFSEVYEHFMTPLAIPIKKI